MYTAVVSIANRFAGSRTLLATLELQAPDNSYRRFRTEVQLAPQRTTDCELRYRVDLPGAYLTSITLEDPVAGRVLASNSGKLALQPIALQLVSHSATIGRPCPFHLTPAIAPDDVERTVVRIRVAPAGGSTDVLNFELPAKDAWHNLPTQGLAPGVYTVNAELVRSGKLLHAVSAALQVDPPL